MYFPYPACQTNAESRDYERLPVCGSIGKLNSSPFTQKLELSIAKYTLEVSVANLLISSYSSGSAIESG